MNLIAWITETRNAEAAKVGKPNKAWACRHLLRYAAGGEMRSQQLEMSSRALGLTKEQVNELSACRDVARPGRGELRAA